MNSARLVNWILPLVITLLALADGVLHFSLDMVLFRGNFVGRLGPPPGAPPPAPGNLPPGPPVPLPLPLNQMFLLNCVGYIILLGLFWFAVRRDSRRGWADVALLVYAAAAFLAWVDFGRPNPMGLGYLSKAAEILLAIALIAHLWLLSRSTVTSSERSFALQTDAHR